MFRKWITRLWRDEQGGELIEFALVVGLVVACIAGAISMLGHHAR